MSQHPRPRGPSRSLALAVALMLPGLAACNTRSEITGAIAPLEYRDRHPIVIADGARVLDVFVEGPTGLAPRSRQDVGAFLAEYGRYGSGPLIAQVPHGFGTNPGTRSALGQIRNATGGRLVVSGYRPNDPTVASPIRLTFKRLQAKVGSKCGLWPDDLGVSDYETSWRNEQYWNLGCAAQSNFASQVADPNDLVRGRQETPPDIGRRMFNFGQIRQGQDPSTNWKAPTIPLPGISSQ